MGAAVRTNLAGLHQLDAPEHYGEFGRNAVVEERKFQHDRVEQCGKCRQMMTLLWEAASGNSLPLVACAIPLDEGAAIGGNE